MARQYQVGDIVLASHISLSVKGELVRLVAEKEIRPAGWCFQWAKAHGSRGLWMPTQCIMRHATSEEVIEFAGEEISALQYEIDYHQRQIILLTNRLNAINASDKSPSETK